MAINISKSEAERMLLWAFENRDRCPLTDSDMEKALAAAKIISGTHKTYRYILVTALLGKALNETLNPLALQAGAPIDGAFDARSLCHTVLVPFERKYLQNGLGGSNEPFLNKPARFTHLSESNAVRAGKDRETLKTLIEVLSNLDMSTAQKLLCHAISAILKNAANREEQFAVRNNFANSLELYHFMRKLLERSCQGETCVILVGAIEKTFYSMTDRKFRVLCHPVNEAGTSHNQIGDIDIFHDDEYCYSIEVKDKNFTANDVDFALSKMFMADAMSGGFIYGPRANFNKAEVDACIQMYEQEKFVVVFEDIFSYLKQMLMVITNIDLTSFKNIMLDTAREINASSDMANWLSIVMAEH